MSLERQPARLLTSAGRESARGQQLPGSRLATSTIQHGPDGSRSDSDCLLSTAEAAAAPAVGEAANVVVDVPAEAAAADGSTRSSALLCAGSTAITRFARGGLLEMLGSGLTRRVLPRIAVSSAVLSGPCKGRWPVI